MNAKELMQFRFPESKATVMRFKELLSHREVWSIWLYKNSVISFATGSTEIEAWDNAMEKFCC